MHSHPNFWNSLLTKLGFIRRKRRTAGKGNFNRRLRFEQCEDRRMLATFTVNSLLDNGDGANTTLREAIEQANLNPDPDQISFSSGLAGQVINITGSNLRVLGRVTITGPSAGSVYVNDNSPTATTGITFASFDLSPTGLSGSTSISNFIFVGFDIGIDITNLVSGGFNFTRPLTIDNVQILNAGIAGIHMENSDIPFEIHNSIIVGTGVSESAGIDIFNSGQYLTTGQPISTGNIDSSHIGNSDLQSGNQIGGFVDGIRVQKSYFPDLRISGNTVGDLDIPNLREGIIEVELHDSAPNTNGVGRIDHNTIIYNGEDGIVTLFKDATIIENNSIAFNGHAGLSLRNGANDFIVQLNTFDSNGRDAIVLDSSADDRNKFSQNTFSGINLAANYLPINLQATANESGQTPNDGNDFDPGPNDLMNYPVINASGITLNGANWSVPFAFDTDVSGDYTLEFYKYTAATNRYDFIDSENVNGVTSGTNDFLGTALIPSSSLAPGNQLAVLAIRGTGTTNIGNTSELSPVVTVPANSPAPTSITLAPSSDTGILGDNRTNRDNSTPANNLQFTVNGTVSNATVRIYSGTTLIGTAVATGSTTTVTTSGTFDLADGLRTLTATQTELGKSESSVVSVGITVDTVAPRVSNVTISGSNTTHVPFAFNRPDDATDFDGSGIQLRTVPVGNADTVTIQFSEHVSSLQASHLVLRGLRSGAVPALVTGTDGFSYSPVTHQATWRFNTPFAANQYVLSLSDLVTDEAFNRLDGEWTNPFRLETNNTLVSEFPSGNGLAGGNFNFVFSMLPGDATLNNLVNTFDYTIWYTNYYGDPPLNAVFTQGDMDGSGEVDYGEDYFVYANFLRDFTQLVSADFNGDGLVNDLDLAIWQAGYEDDSAGDADGDGDVDGVDYLIWQRQSGLELTWVA